MAGRGFQQTTDARSAVQVWFVPVAGNRLAVSDHTGRTIGRSARRPSTAGRCSVFPAYRRLSTIQFGYRTHHVRSSETTAPVVVIGLSTVVVVGLSTVVAELSTVVTVPPTSVAVLSSVVAVVLVVVTVLLNGVKPSSTGCGEATD